MFGPVTRREQIGWQVRALRALADFLAAHRDLPPVTFTVPPGMRAVVLLRGALDGDEASRRAVVDAYAAALGAAVTVRARSALAAARIDNVEITVVAETGGGLDEGTG